MLYATGYLALRPSEPSSSGALPPGVHLPDEVRHGVESISASTETEALAIGLQLALFKLPSAQGWMSHQVVTCAVTDVLKPVEDWV